MAKYSRGPLAEDVVELGIAAESGIQRQTEQIIARSIRGDDPFQGAVRARSGSVPVKPARRRCTARFTDGWLVRELSARWNGGQQLRAAV